MEAEVAIGVLLDLELVCTEHSSLPFAMWHAVQIEPEPVALYLLEMMIRVVGPTIIPSPPFLPSGFGLMNPELQWGPTNENMSPSNKHQINTLRLF